jgi:ferredoxin-nitrate reductase
VVTDRIADIWGGRTAYAAGEEWPARTDQYLADGVAEADVTWVQSACVLCSMDCGMDVAVRDGRIVGVRGRTTDRVNHGRLGPKGLFGWQANASPSRWCAATASWSRPPGTRRWIWWWSGPGRY